jgi:hypothetical protein
MEEKDLEFFVYLNGYQEGPFIVKGKTALDAIEIAINENVHTHPSYFATASEITNPNHHFMSRTGIFVRDNQYPTALIAHWEA